MTDDHRLTAKEVAKMLGFTTTNLKHYASLLELNGLEIYRNTRNHREYSQHDVNILRAMIRVNRDKSVSLEDAASLVMSSDTNIEAILYPELSQEFATNDEYISEPVRVLQQDSVDDSRELAIASGQLTQAIVVINALREELESRDKLSLEFQSEISKQLEEQSATIQELRKELTEMKEAKPSLWSRIFGK